MTKVLWAAFFIAFSILFTGSCFSIEKPKAISKQKAEQLAGQYLQANHWKFDKAPTASLREGNCDLVVQEAVDRWQTETVDGCYYVDFLTKWDPNSIKDKPVIVISLDGKKIGALPRD